MMLVAIDLDGTLWDHLNVSELRPPLRRVGGDSLADSAGVVVTVRRGIREFLGELRGMEGIILSTLSWNNPRIAVEALRTLSLDEYFDYLVVEDHPHKDKMLLKLLKKLSENGVRIPPECIVYLDDRDIHVEDIWRSIGRKVTFVRMPSRDEDVPSILRETLNIIREKRKTCEA